MSADRTDVETALRSIVATDLRRRGFTGSLPHLRRKGPDRIDLISFQFHSAGGSFVVEVANCPPTGHTTSWGKHIEPGKVRAQDIGPPHRPRLGSPTFPIGDHWFSFGPRSYEERPRQSHTTEHYEQVAAEVIGFLDQQAEPFWAGEPPT